jgi:hypothetical protein
VLAADIADHGRPMPMASRGSPRASRSSFQRASAAIVISAHWSALAASSSFTVGTPSPRKSHPDIFSTVPPQAKICAVIRSWSSRSSVTTASGIMASAMPVKPTMSQHSTRQSAAARPPAESELAVADLTAEALRDQRLEISLVVDPEDLRRAHQSAAAGS